MCVRAISKSKSLPTATSSKGVEEAAPGTTPRPQRQRCASHRWAIATADDERAREADGSLEAS